MTAPTLTAPPADPIADPAFRPTVYPDLIVDPIAHSDEVILLHPFEARWALTNQTGLRLAQLFDGSRTVWEAAFALAERYGLPVEGILPDTEAFGRQLHRANLLLNAPIPAPPKPAPKPPSLTIYVTEECNLRCKHCAIVEGKMPETLLSNEDIRRLIREHTTNHKNPTISFLGGEPLLRPDIVELLHFAAGCTNRVTMSTNGLLVDDAMAQALSEVENLELQVSLDGADPAVHDFIRGKGSYEKTWAAIERLCAAGMARRLVLATTLTKAVLPQLKELIGRAEALDLLMLRFLNLNKMRAAETNWDRISAEPAEMITIYRWLLIDRPRESRPTRTAIRASFPGFVPDLAPNAGAWCPLGKTLIVDSQGQAYNCPVLNTADYTIGNARVQPLSEIEASERNRVLRESTLNRRYVIEECKNCSWRNFCQGGCTAYSSLRSGDVYVNDEFCDLRRDLYRAHVRQVAGKSGGP